MLKTIPLALAGIYEVTPPRYHDERGFFSETWNSTVWCQAGIDAEFVQDNHSLSLVPGVIRGLHYQLPPMAQDKLVRVTRGSIFDVAVDIRRSSPTFGHWVGRRLSAAEGNQLFVPKGFAHGFMTIEANTEVQYKVSQPHSPSLERAIRFDDPEIGIEWPIGFDRLLSAKDMNAPSLASAETFE